MKVALHRLAEGEADYELLALGVCGGTVALGAGWLAAGWPLPHCAFHALTGCPCPACGGTRCVLALLRGKVAEAAGWNPLVFLGVMGGIGYNAYAAAVAGLGWRRVRCEVSAGEARVLRVAAGVGILMNWGYLFYRGV